MMGKIRKVLEGGGERKRKKARGSEKERDYFLIRKP